MSFSKNRTQIQSTSFLFLRAEDEAVNIKALAIEVDIGTMPFNTEHEQRGRGAERRGASRENNENQHHTWNKTSSLNKKLSSSKQPSSSSSKSDDLLLDYSKASLVSMNSRNSTDLVDQTSSVALAVAFQLQQNPQSIELARQTHREFLSKLKNTYTSGKYYLIVVVVFFSSLIQRETVASVTRH